MCWLFDSSRYEFHRIYNLNDFLSLIRYDTVKKNNDEVDHDHIILLDELQKQSEFMKLIGERGKVEDVRDYMLTDLKTY